MIKDALFVVASDEALLFKPGCHCVFPSNWGWRRRESPRAQVHAPWLEPMMRNASSIYWNLQDSCLSPRWVRKVWTFPLAPYVRAFTGVCALCAENGADNDWEDEYARAFASTAIPLRVLWPRRVLQAGEYHDGTSYSKVITLVSIATNIKLDWQNHKRTFSEGITNNIKC